MPIFTYHIVNIKPPEELPPLVTFVLFTYHIVNIKRYGAELKRMGMAKFTYHIVNIKQLVSPYGLLFVCNLHIT